MLVPSQVLCVCLGVLALMLRWLLVQGFVGYLQLQMAAGAWWRAACVLLLCACLWQL